MNRDELASRLETELQSATWSNEPHRDALRRQLRKAVTRPTRSSASRRHRLVIAIAALTALSATGAAAFRWRDVIFLRGSISDEPTMFELPVDDDGNVRLLYTDETGAEHELLVRPDDVGADGVIRGMEWHSDDAPETPEQQEP